MLPRYEIINADIIQWAKGHEWLVQNVDGPFHFIFGDWPYNLESIAKRFGGENAAPAKPGQDGSFQRQSRGFLGSAWDTDLGYNAKTWRLLKRLLLPGGFTASFSHARKFHRLILAQEQAGFLINPTIDTRSIPATLAWIYSTGKPNGTSVSPQIDRAAGVEPLLVGDLAKVWKGFQYGSPLSPEYEPIVIAQKPYEGRPVDSITQTGAGAYNISAGKTFQTNGRFPGTIALVHHPGCKRVGWKEVKPNGATTTGGVSSGSIYGVMHGGTSYTPQVNENGKELVPAYQCHPHCPVSQSPGPDKAHYFAQADWVWEIVERLSITHPYIYASKVSPKERNAGCYDLPEVVRKRANSGGLANTDAWKDTLHRNPHPCLKSIAMTKYLASLFLPPKEYAPRRVLIPTAGTGSEAIGCLLAGWDEIVTVELDPNYCRIGEARMKFFYEFVKYGQTDIDAILATVSESVGPENNQLSLLDLVKE